MANTSKPNRSIALFFIIYATMFLMGLVENIKGVSFPLIKAEFGVPYDSQGGLVSLTGFGFIIFSLLAAIFLQRFGVKKAILTGYILLVLGSLATLLAPSFWWATGTLFIVNAGFGFFDIGNHALASMTFRNRAALMMNLMHFFYGVGAILGPNLAGVMTEAMGFNWRQVYVAVIIPTALLFFYVLFTRFGNLSITDGEEAPRPAMTLAQAFRRSDVWLVSITLGFMVVADANTANWGSLYLKDVYGLDPRTTGSTFISLYFIVFTFSRFISGLIIEKIGYLRALFLGLWGALIVFVAGFLLGEKGIWILPFSGFFLAIMWPTIMAVVVKVFGSDAPAVTSVVITVAGSVNGILQLLVGFTNQYIGAAWGYRSTALYCAIAIALLALLAKRIKASPEPAVSTLQ